jgi:hypothetical protein
MAKTRKIKKRHKILMVIRMRAVWFNQNVMDAYRIVDGKKIQPDTLEGYDALCDMLSEKNINKYVLPPIAE